MLISEFDQFIKKPATSWLRSTKSSNTAAGRERSPVPNPHPDMTNAIRAAVSGAYFFVGAGASHRVCNDPNAPADFPLGTGLLKDFLDSIKSDHHQDLPSEQKKWALENSIHTSIDSLLDDAWSMNYFKLIDAGREFVDNSIAKAEREVLDRCGDGMISPWLELLLDFMTEGETCYPEAYDQVKPYTANAPGLQFGTLNYDRVIEYSLLNYLKRKYPNAEATILEDLSRPCSLIHHHHGSLGTLAERPFGGSNQNQKASLEFWFEKKNKPRYWKIDNALRNSRDAWVVLGFGFHEQITSRFDFDGAAKQIYVTDFDDSIEPKLREFLKCHSQPKAIRSTGDDCCMELIAEWIRSYAPKP